jgi:hypothetical protein
VSLLRSSISFTGSIATDMPLLTELALLLFVLFRVVSVFRGSSFVRCSNDIRSEVKEPNNETH